MRMNMMSSHTLRRVVDNDPGTCFGRKLVTKKPVLGNRRAILLDKNSSQNYINLIKSIVKC